MLIRYSHDARTRFPGVAKAALPLVLMLALTACNASSFSDGLRPAQRATTQDTVPLDPQTTARPAEPVGNETALTAEPQGEVGAQAALQEQQPARVELPPVAFLPVSGAPQSTVTSLAGSMREAAQRETLAIVPSTEQSARYRIKGYFSALKDGNGTLLVYVWDVLDRNDTRVHRISGQERGGASSGDPWTAITPDLIEKVADTTMTQLRSWMAQRSAG